MTTRTIATVLMHELIYTSAQNTLDGAGYGVVARTSGFPVGVEASIRQRLNQFDFESSGGSAKPRPVFSCVSFRDGQQSWKVLSRVGASGVDYTHREVFLAHHIVIREDEESELNAAALMLEPQLFQSSWDGRVGAIPQRPVPSLRAVSRKAETWRTVAGDPNWVTVWGRLWLERKGKLPQFLIVSDHADLLRLFAEGAAVLPPGSLSQLTFLTDLTSERSGLELDWVGLRSESEIARQILAAAGDRVLDIRMPKGKAPSIAAHVAEVTTEPIPPRHRSFGQISPGSLTGGYEDGMEGKAWHKEPRAPSEINGLGGSNSVPSRSPLGSTAPPPPPPVPLAQQPHLLSLALAASGGGLIVAMSLFITGVFDKPHTAQKHDPPVTNTNPVQPIKTETPPVKADASPTEVESPTPKKEVQPVRNEAPPLDTVAAPSAEKPAPPVENPDLPVKVIDPRIQSTPLPETKPPAPPAKTPERPAQAPAKPAQVPEKSALSVPLFRVVKKGLLESQRANHSKENHGKWSVLLDTEQKVRKIWLRTPQDIGLGGEIDRKSPLAMTIVERKKDSQAIVGYLQISDEGLLKWRYGESFPHNSDDSLGTDTESDRGNNTTRTNEKSDRNSPRERYLMNIARLQLCVLEMEIVGTNPKSHIMRIAFTPEVLFPLRKEKATTTTPEFQLDADQENFLTRSVELGGKSLKWQLEKIFLRFQSNGDFCWKPQPAEFPFDNSSPQINFTIDSFPYSYKTSAKLKSNVGKHRRDIDNPPYYFVEPRFEVNPNTISKDSGGPEKKTPTRNATEEVDSVKLLKDMLYRFGVIQGSAYVTMAPADTEESNSSELEDFKILRFALPSRKP